MRIGFFLVALSLVAGCGLKGKIKKLGAAERTHYEALKVFMDDDQEKTWLKLKTEDERDAWLKANAAAGERVGMQTPLWEMFYQYDQARRDAIAEGGVAIGWSKDQVLMAWGQPHETRRTAKRTATRSEIYLYRFEVTPKNEVMVWVPNSSATYKAIDTFQYDVHIDDDVVTEITKKEQWDR